jgi:hypothetical protein
METPDYPGSFQIRETASIAGPNGSKKTWLATVVRGSRRTAFRIELLLKPKKGDSPFAFSRGALVREKGADGAWFLRELAGVLEARNVPTRAVPANRLDFDVAILGVSLSRGAGPDEFAGGFTSSPPGRWMALKAFVANGEGEFFLNLNPATGRGEVAIKDPEYGDVVVRELARILLRSGGT